MRGSEADKVRGVELHAAASFRVAELLGEGVVEEEGGLEV